VGTNKLQQGFHMRNTLLSVAGFYCFVFVVFHLSFWKLFRWKSDLQRLTPLNRAVMQVLNLRLTYVLLVAGIALLLFQESMCATDLGRFVLGAMSLFWLMRAIEQIVFFGLSKVISTVLLVVFLIGGALFAIPLFL
jgi:hypothetical protein